MRAQTTILVSSPTHKTSFELTVLSHDFKFAGGVDCISISEFNAMRSALCRNEKCKQCKDIIESSRIAGFGPVSESGEFVAIIYQGGLYSTTSRGLVKISQRSREKLAEVKRRAHSLGI